MLESSYNPSLVLWSLAVAVLAHAHHRVDDERARRELGVVARAREELLEVGEAYLALGDEVDRGTHGTQSEREAEGVLEEATGN